MIKKQQIASKRKNKSHKSKKKNQHAVTLSYTHLQKCFEDRKKWRFSFWYFFQNFQVLQKNQTP